MFAQNFWIRRVVKLWVIKVANWDRYGFFWRSNEFPSVSSCNNIRLFYSLSISISSLEKRHSWSENWQGIQVVELISTLCVYLLPQLGGYRPWPARLSLPCHCTGGRLPSSTCSFRSKEKARFAHLFLLLSFLWVFHTGLCQTGGPNRVTETAYGFNILFVLAGTKSIV